MHKHLERHRPEADTGASPRRVTPSSRRQGVYLAQLAHFLPAHISTSTGFIEGWPLSFLSSWDGSPVWAGVVLAVLSVRSTVPAALPARGVPLSKYLLNERAHFSGET